MFRECEKQALRELRRAKADGLQPWAIQHCESILLKAKWHRSEAADKDQPRNRREFSFDRAIGECLQVSEICKAYSMMPQPSHEAGAKPLADHAAP